jgi:glycine cleavage system H protein
VNQKLSKERIMEIPKDLRYTDSDEWVRVEGDEAVMGISDYAQEQLSDIVYVEFTVDVGDEVAKGDSVSAVESVKAAADVYTPISGTISAINEELPDTPELINTDPYGEAWMIKIKMADPSEVEALKDPDAYQAYCEERDH